MKTENNVGDLSQLPSDDKKDELKLEQTDLKICGICEVAKPFHLFYSKHNGLDSACKSCRCVQRKKRYKSSVGNTFQEPPLYCKKLSKEISDKPSLLSLEDIQKIAEAMLILEGWQMDLDTQRDLSNSNLISPIKQK